MRSQAPDAAAASPGKRVRRPRAPRLRGRLGIDLNAQSPTALPPLIASSSSSPRHGSYEKQRHDEIVSLQREFRQRLHATKKLVDLSPLLAAVAHVMEEEKSEASDPHADHDCFTAAKRVTSCIESSAPFLSQFLDNLISKMQQLAHDKVRHEAVVLEQSGPLSPRATQLHAPDPSLDAPSESEDSSSLSSPESDNDDEVTGHDDRSDSDAEKSPAVDIAKAVPTTDVRAIPKGPTFRRTKRSRQFPPSRVPPDEFVQTSFAYMPFDHLKKPDLSSLRLTGHDDLGSAQWTVVLFPKQKPTLCHDEFESFLQWAQARQSAFEAQYTSIGEPTYTEMEERIKAQLELKALICYELSRLVFDKCPTTSRFLHGLFEELVTIALRTLANAEREAQIVEQRYKNVQLELSRLKEKLVKVQASLASLETTLGTRQQRLLRERELIIRKRKTLNLYLCADQILIRNVAAIIHHAIELAEDLVQTRPAPGGAGGAVTSQTPLVLFDPDSRYGLVDDTTSLVIEKYGALREVSRTRTKWLDAHDARSPSERSAQRESSAAHRDEDQPVANSHVIVIDTNDLKTATDAYKGTLSRLSRIISSKSPDSSIGWDAQELWDQALFIPPHEEIQDLERDIQQLCRHVEQRIIQQRRNARDSVCHVAVQTDISACVPAQPRTRAFTMASLQAAQQRHRRNSIDDTIARWNWRSRKQSSTREAGTVDTATEIATTTTMEDHAHLLEKVLPLGFRPFIQSIPSDYEAHQLGLNDIHAIISYIFNGIWMLVQEDFHRPHRFSTNPSEHSLIPLTGIHEYVYRIYLQHFRVSTVVASRLLDLLVSSSRLDTQSCKILLFCRLLGMPGVAHLASDGFWFMLKALHALQRACVSSGNYFMLDGEGDNEFVSQASASEALGLLFAGASNEVMKRLRLKLSGLASVYGTVWIPAYNVLTFIMDEWSEGQDVLRQTVEEKLFLDHAAEEDPFTGARIFNDNHVVTFDEFVKGFSILQLKVSRAEAVHAYRTLLRDSRSQAVLGSGDTSAGGPPINRHLFYTNWMQMILHAINLAQQQMLQPIQLDKLSGAGSGHHAGSGATGTHGVGVQLGAIADAMLAANVQLSQKFIATSWHQMKPEIIRRLDAKFKDVGLQVRLVQQMEAILNDRTHAVNNNGGWRNLQQLIQIAYDTNTAASPVW